MIPEGKKNFTVVTSAVIITTASCALIQAVAVQWSEWLLGSVRAFYDRRWTCYNAGVSRYKSVIYTSVNNLYCCAASDLNVNKWTKINMFRDGTNTNTELTIQHQSIPPHIPHLPLHPQTFRIPALHCPHSLKNTCPFVVYFNYPIPHVQCIHILSVHTSYLCTYYFSHGATTCSTQQCSWLHWLSGVSEVATWMLHLSACIVLC